MTRFLLEKLFLEPTAEFIFIPKDNLDSLEIEDAGNLSGKIRYQVKRNYLRRQGFFSAFHRKAHSSYLRRARNISYSSASGDVRSDVPRATSPDSASIEGRALIRTLPEFGRKLNRVIMCGKDAPMEESDFKELDSVYGPCGGSPQLHLSPFASAFSDQVLAAHGYIQNKVLGIYWYDIQNWPTEFAPGVANGVLVRLAEPHEAKRFIKASVAGFQDKGRDEKLLELLSHLAIRRKDMTYFALINGEVAGTAAMALMDTADGGAAHFYLDSTIPAHRGRGVHQSLIRARLRDARQLGLRLVTDITTVGDGSARNAERAGLRLAYTSPVFTAQPTPQSSSINDQLNRCNTIIPPDLISE